MIPNQESGMQEMVIQMDGKPVSRVAGSPRLADVATLLAGEPEVYLVYDRNVAWVADAVEAVLSGAATEDPGTLSAGAGTGGVSGPVLRGRWALDATEAGKDMAAVMDICAWLLGLGASRGALLLAIGGGITTDMAGFAASIYKRGIRYANIPTTLLAQVDAGIGGKTGVNFLDFKNMLGVIVQPVFTFLCAETLRTLPPRDVRSGAAELLKTFLIEDRDDHYARAVRLLSYRNQAENGHETTFSDGSCPKTAENRDEWGRELQALIFAAAAVKAGVVSRDPYERGERRCLNLGHTFAHAIEHNARIKGDDITHGEAVAMGMVLAARLSDRRASISGNPATPDAAGEYPEAPDVAMRPSPAAGAQVSVRKAGSGKVDWCVGCPDRAGCGRAGGGMEARLRADFAVVGLPVDCPYPLPALAEAMDKDKKAVGGRVRFQIPLAVGRVGEVALTVEEALRLLSEAGNGQGTGNGPEDGNI